MGTTSRPKTKFKRVQTHLALRRSLTRPGFVFCYRHFIIAFKDKYIIVVQQIIITIKDFETSRNFFLSLSNNLTENTLCRHHIMWGKGGEDEEGIKRRARGSPKVIAHISSASHDFALHHDVASYDQYQRQEDQFLGVVSPSNLLDIQCSKMFK